MEAPRLRAIRTSRDPNMLGLDVDTLQALYYTGLGGLRLSV